MSTNWPLYTDVPVTEEVEKQRLLEYISRAAARTVRESRLSEATYGKVCHRGLFRRTQWLYFWPIVGLQQPLWLGSDGNIYRAHADWCEDDARLFQQEILKPHHWRLAHIEQRKISGLRRLLDVLTPDCEE